MRIQSIVGYEDQKGDIVCVCVCVLIAHSVSVEADILKQLMLVITLEEWIEGSATGAFWGWFINS